MIKYDELKEKYRDDKDLIEFVEDLNTKANTNYLEDNIKLKAENEKLKSHNNLLYSQLMNGGKRKEDEEDGAGPRFHDYTNDIVETLRNRKK